MRSVAGLTLCATLGLAAISAAGQKPAEPWMSHGAGVTLKKSTRLGKLGRSATTTPEREVLTLATVTEVCATKGCWMTVADGRDTMRVEFRDYGFFVPWESAGRRIRMQGVVREREMSPEEQDHLAAESRAGAGAKAAAPKKVRLFVASGVEIEGGGPISDEQRAIIEGKPKGGHGHGHDGHRH